MGIREALQELEAAVGVVKQALEDDELVTPLPVDPPRMQQKVSGPPAAACPKNTGCVHPDGNGHEGGCVFEGEFSPVDMSERGEPG